MKTFSVIYENSLKVVAGLDDASITAATATVSGGQAEPALCVRVAQVFRYLTFGMRRIPFFKCEYVTF